MSLSLIHNHDIESSTAERVLSQNGFRNYNSGPVKGFVYGCGLFVPGEDYEKIFLHYLSSSFSGACGLCIDIESIIESSPEIRSVFGGIYKTFSSDKIFVSDSTSKELSLHWGFESEVGGHPAWFASNKCCWEVLSYKTKFIKESELGLIWQGKYKYFNIYESKGNNKTICSISYGDIGCAIASFLIGNPCLLLIPNRDWGCPAPSGNPYGYHPLSRFAVDHGLEDLLCSHDNLQEKIASFSFNLNEEFIENRKKEATQTLDILSGKTKKKKSLQSIFDSVQKEFDSKSNQITPTLSVKPKELAIGSVFDPSTHYTKEYYGGGSGLKYQKPDGTWGVYHGTSTSWHGNDIVLDILQSTIGLKDKKMLDVGCSSGDFVYRARKRGLESFGIDISKEAIGQANPDIENVVFCDDVLNTKIINKLCPFDFISLLDFWEHIWFHKIDTFIQSLSNIMSESALMFCIIATRSDHERDWTIKPGEIFTRENSWLLCSGHVTIRTWDWWVDKFSSHGLKIRDDIAYRFQIKRSESESLSRVASWGPRNLIVCQRERDMDKNATNSEKSY